MSAQRIPGYWPRLAQARLSRRRTLKAGLGAGVGLSALSLLGCRQDDRSEALRNIITDPNAIIYNWQMPDETKDAVPGGVYRSVTTGDTGSFDPIKSSDFVTQVLASVVYETLLGFKSGPGLNPAEGLEIEGRLAEGYDVSRDATTFTFKLRPDVRFHDISPVSGRVMEIEDWRQSLERYLAISPFKENLVQIHDSTQYPDARTMTFKTKYPYAPAARLFASGTASFWVLPKEAAGGPMNPEQQVIGTAYRQLDKFQVSVTWEYKKNPLFRVKDRPFIDRWHYPIMPEYAQRFAQFIVGNVLEFTPRTQEVLQVQKDAPQTRMFKTDAGGSFGMIYFGQKDYETSPWRDDRVRQAMSMLIDRSALRAHFSNSSEFAAAGFPTDDRWHTHVKAGLVEYWLDPAQDKLGPASKFFKYDVAEARKLMSAAGFPNGIGEIDCYYATPATLGRDHGERVVITLDMFEKSGLVKPNRFDKPYLEALNNYYLKRDFQGLVLTPEFTFVDVDLELFGYYHSRGNRFKLIERDARVDDMIEKQRTELDSAKRISIIQDFQKYMAEKMYVIPWDGVSSGFTFKWPWIRNSAYPGWNEWLSADMPRRNG
jgi:ABC-type transport system substrate-binding protein